MKVLFYFYSARVWRDRKGDLYAGGEFSSGVWRRYLSISDELYCACRLSDEVLSTEVAESTREKVDTTKIHMILLPDRTKSIWAYLSKKMKRELYHKVDKAIESCDAVITRTTDSRLIKYIKKHDKLYLIEVVGDTWDAHWNHGIKGKLFAIPSYVRARWEIRRAPWVLYVTNQYLQERYPTTGESIGCSDVLIEAQRETVLEKRKQFIFNSKEKFIIGTLAAVNVKYKGQEFVIKALADLKREGITYYQYQLVGSGDISRLKKLAIKLGVESQVSFLGPMPHQQVFDWMKQIDLYIQPSKQEGLPRSVIEAMSVAVPVAGSRIGGIPELISDRMIFDAGDVKQIVSLLSGLDNKILEEEAAMNYRKSLEFDSELLDKKRNAFYLKFLMESGAFRGE